MIPENDYKELMALKEQLLRAEDSEETERAMATLRTRLLMQKVQIEEQLKTLQELDEIYDEILIDL